MVDRLAPSVSDQDGWRGVSDYQILTKSAWKTEGSEALFSRKMRKEPLIQGWGSDRFRSFVTRRPGEALSEVNMRNVGPVGLTSRGRQVTVDGGATLLTTICVSEGVPLTTTLRY